ncbi:MAG: NAD-dependent epimerase/dehydratase family protein, partial [Phycisphaerales bacterium]
VTGGAGFIGGHLVDALLSMGASITVIDDLSNSTASHVAELVEMEPDRVRFVHGSILEDRALREAVEQTAIVFHLAAVGSVPLSIVEPDRSFTVNALGTVRVLEAARSAHARRVVYSASSSAYGESETLPKRESDLPAPVSPYAAGKLAGEHAAHAWARSYPGLSTVSLRYFNVFGPRQPGDSPYSAVIAAFARRLLAGESPTIFGDGSQTRDFTYITNAVLANLLAGASDRPLAGEVVNIGSGERVSLLELARRMAKACGREHLAPAFAPPRAGDVMHSLADVAAARELLDYAPIAPLDEGLDATLDWYRSIMDGTTQPTRA